MSETKKRLPKPLKITILSILSVLGALLLAVIIYVSYVLIQYSRIPDGISLEVNGDEVTSEVKVGETYTIVTQNIGFGAYTRDFTFFMDGGTQSWAESPESVTLCVNVAADTIKGFEPDFVLLQEVDVDSTRSYHIDQKGLLNERFDGYCSVFASNYHSAFLMYPFYQPHGASNSGILTYSRYAVTGSVRRSLPISTGLSKFLDLDRCYSVSRVAVEGERELVIYNVHMSAYGGSPEIREAQMRMLFEDMRAEYEKGNYCVCGGDFNHDFTGDSQQVLNGQTSESFEWAQPLPTELMPSCILVCKNYDGEYAPTCRNCDVPYSEGNFTVIVDGFLVSDNVEAVSVKNINTGFEYSDHNPVVLEFKLK